MERQCTACGVKDADHFTYKSKQGIKFFPKCKKCHNAGTYIKRPTGWAKIDPETQKEILKAMGDKWQKLSHIAKRFDLSYSTLRKWIMRGDLGPAREEDTE